MEKQKWWKKGFVMSTFEATGHLEMVDLQECKRRVEATRDAGYDIIEITWKTPSTTETILSVCDELNIPVILEDPFADGKMCPAIRERNAESVSLLLDAYKKYKSCIKGIYIFDEPMFQHFDECAEMQQALKEIDEEILPFFALVPSYGPYTFKNGQYPTYVNDFISKIDPEVISFDYYCFWQHCIKNPINRNPLWKDMGFWRLKSIETKKPFWWYFQGINFGPKVPENESHLVITPAHWSVQMYTGLAFNAKGLSCYNSYGSILDLEGNKTHLYDDICVLNRKVKLMGEKLYNAKPLAIYHTGLRPQEEKEYFADAYENNPYFSSDTKAILVSCFEENGKKMFLVLNKCYKKGKNVAINLKGKNVHSFDSDIKLKKTSDEIKFYLPAGGAALLVEE